MVDWLSLAVPLAYLGVLIGSLATFSSLYRKRKSRMYSINRQRHLLLQLFRFTTNISPYNRQGRLP